MHRLTQIQVELYNKLLAEYVCKWFEGIKIQHIEHGPPEPRVTGLQLRMMLNCTGWSRSGHRNHYKAPGANTAEDRAWAGLVDLGLAVGTGLDYYACTDDGYRLLYAAPREC